MAPADYSAVTHEADRDKITPITCTPYGINSDRLPVTAGSGRAGRRSERDPPPFVEDGSSGGALVSGSGS